MIPRALSKLPAPDIWVYPVEKLLEFRSIFDRVKGPSAYDVEEQKNGILTRLWKLDQLSFDPDECDFSGARTHYMAMVDGKPTGIWAATPMAISLRTS